MKQSWSAQAMLAPSLPEAMLPVVAERSVASMGEGRSMAPALHMGNHHYETFEVEERF